MGKPDKRCDVVIVAETFDLCFVRTPARLHNLVVRGLSRKFPLKQLTEGLKGSMVDSED